MRAVFALSLLVASLLIPASAEPCSRNLSFFEMIGSSSAVITADVVSSQTVDLNHSFRKQGTQHELCNVELVAGKIDSKLKGGCVSLIVPLPNQDSILSNDDSLPFLSKDNYYLLFLDPGSPFGLPSVSSTSRVFERINFGSSQCAFTKNVILNEVKDLNLLYKQASTSSGCTTSFNQFVSSVEKHASEAYRLYGEQYRTGPFHNKPRPK